MAMCPANTNIGDITVRYNEADSWLEPQTKPVGLDKQKRHFGRFFPVPPSKLLEIDLEYQFRQSSY